MAKVLIDEAVRILNESSVVAVPTETVYGLAGLISSPEAIDKIFSTKQRPSFDPLIVHVLNKHQAKKHCVAWNEVHSLLADAFWPGPLTLVVSKSPLVSDSITAGLSTVGLRAPNHPLALELLQKLGSPFAAPSANMFSKTSPTTAEHVEQEFSMRVPVLDGGPCTVGLESTICHVVDIDPNLNTCGLHVLRRGAVLPEQLEQALKKHGWQTKAEVTNVTVAPGQLKVHYQPSVPLVLIKNDLLSDREAIDACMTKFNTQVPCWLNLNPQPELAARTLYAQLRQLSAPPTTLLLCRWDSSWTSDAWMTIFDRLSKASREIVE